MNNRVITKPYAGKRGIRQKVTSGFATVEQKGKLIGLEVLVDATVIFNNVEQKLKAGDIAFFPEDLLHGAAWSNKIMSCDEIKEPFIMTDGGSIVMVK
ncbi:MAG TPA: hypothetical protein ENK75_03190 [Saprospiraceae bacterium]|nr:hypothetical protein [Saprospiraceae bacterium]